MKFRPAIRLFSAKNDLNIISFLLLMLSDIFIGIILFYGLSQQIDQFTDEYEYFPYAYRSMLIDRNWVENNVLEKITDFVLENKRLTYEKDEKPGRLHPKCAEISRLFEIVEKDSKLVESLEAYERLNKNYYNMTENERLTLKGGTIYLRLKTAEAALNNNEEIKLLVKTVFENQKQDYTKDIIRYRKIFALKRTLFDFIFLLPVLIIFVLWNRRSFLNDRYIQVIVSSHYIIVAFLPIFFECIRLIKEVIPKILLKTIYDFLLDLNLITFWYYALLLICIPLIVLLIWFFQTKIFTKERYRIKQYEKSRCMTCNTRISYTNSNCPACGSVLYMKCQKCGKMTVNSLPYCINCGNHMVLK